MRYMIGLREFFRCNRERTQASDVDVYFGAIPQLIIQSYIASQKALDTHVYEVPVSTWVSICSSAVFVLRYEPTARQGQKGMIFDIETVMEPTMYDYIAEIVFDFIFVVPRIISIGAFLTVGHSYIPTIVFFTVHFAAGFFVVLAIIAQSR